MRVRAALEIRQRRERVDALQRPRKVDRRRGCSSRSPPALTRWSPRCKRQGIDRLEHVEDRGRSATTWPFRSCHAADVHGRADRCRSPVRRDRLRVYCARASLISAGRQRGQIVRRDGLIRVVERGAAADVIQRRRRCGRSRCRRRTGCSAPADATLRRRPDGRRDRTRWCVS